MGINERWEQGIPHNEQSESIFKILQESDTDLIFDWKSGGDGDNGETLMYLLDEYFEKKERK